MGASSPVNIIGPCLCSPFYAYDITTYSGYLLKMKMSDQTQTTIITWRNSWSMILTYTSEPEHEVKKVSSATYTDVVRRSERRNNTEPTVYK